MDNNFQVEYVGIDRENVGNCLSFMNLGYEYMKEIAPYKSLEIHNKILNSILNQQNEKEQWLIALRLNANMIGFTHFTVDRRQSIGLAYVLEFYIMPDFRKKGLGRQLYNFIKKELINCGIKNIWLTADKVNGELFWYSIGFMDTGEIENGLKILEISF